MDFKSILQLRENTEQLDLLKTA